MIIVDILCFYSCVRILFLGGSYRKIRYILNGDGWLDRVMSTILRLLGRELEQLEYEIGSNDNTYIDMHRDGIDTSRKHMRPVIEAYLRYLSAFSDYEKGRLAGYLELLEKRGIFQSIELLHLLTSKTLRIDRPDLVLLRSSRWNGLMSEKYCAKGYRVEFYKILFPFKLSARKGYSTDKFVKKAVASGVLTSILFIARNLMSGILLSAYFGVLKRFRAGVLSEIGKFEVVAVVPSLNRREWFSDLFWNKDLKFQTLAMLYGRFDPIAHSAHGIYAKRWICGKGVSYPPSIYSVYYWLWPEFPKILARNISKIIRDVAFSAVPLNQRLIILNLYISVSKFETLFTLSGARVLWSSIEDNDMDSVGAMIAMHRMKGVSVGSTWSAHSFTHIDSQRETNDICFLWGKRHAEIFIQAGTHFKSAVLVGYPGDDHLNHFVARAGALRREWKHRFGCEKIICFYNNVFSRDGLNSNSDMMGYLHSLFHWVKKTPKTLLVVKTKTREMFDQYPMSIAEILKYLEVQGKLAYGFEKADLAPGLASDVVLGFGGAATLPSLLGTYGKNVIVFDSRRFTESWPINGGDNLKFVANIDDFISNLERTISRTSREDEIVRLKPTPNQLDAFADGRAAERVASYLSDIISELKRGASSGDAINCADTRYMSRWGEDKVVSLISSLK